MTVKNFLLTLSILLVFAGCNSSKKVYKEHRDISKTKDSIVKVVEKVFIEGVNDTVYVDQPCDSLGNLKDIHVNIGGTQGTTTLTNDNGRLKLTTDIKPVSSINQFDYNMSDSSRHVVDVKEVKVVRVVWSKWTYIWMFIAIGEFVYILYGKGLFEGLAKWILKLFI